MSRETWFGSVRSMHDAIILLEAARLGIIPRITSRLNERDRIDLVRSGAVFVFEEHESKIRRWADSKAWTSSRSRGQYLTYREVVAEPVYDDNGVGLPPAYTGLYKTALNIHTVYGQIMRLIAYYKHVDLPRLPTVDQDPRFKNVVIEPGFYLVDYVPEVTPATTSIVVEQALAHLTPDDWAKNTPPSTPPHSIKYVEPTTNLWSHQLPPPPSNASPSFEIRYAQLDSEDRRQLRLMDMCFQ